MGRFIGALVVVGIAIYWFAHGGIKTVVSVAEPNLEQISSTAETPFFDDPSLHQTYRNKGAGGKVLLTITQADHAWKRLVYFDREEQREIVFKVPGLQNGKFTTAWKPADLATEAELQGALSG